MTGVDVVLCIVVKPIFAHLFTAMLLWYLLVKTLPLSSLPVYCEGKKSQ